MAFEKVSEFYKRAVDEQRFSEDFLAEAKSISSEDKLRDFFEEKVLPIAKSMGYDFTVDDLIAYERQVIRELSQEELENITGGISLRRISTAFLSLLMITSNIRPMSSAILPRDVIIGSANLLTGKSSSAEDAIESRGAAAAASASDEQAEGMDRSVVVDSTEPCKSTSSGYVLKALNLLDPYALKMTGVTQDVRFFDGNTTSLKARGDVQEGSIPQRKYNEDQGEGSPNYMRTLFPSSAGDLSTAGGYDKFARFSADCNPSPELVARAAAYFSEFRNSTNKDKMNNDLNQCEKNLSELGEKLFNRFYGMLEDYNRAYEEYNKVEEKSMSVRQYLTAAIEGKTDYKVPAEILQKIKWTYVKNNIKKYKDLQTEVQSKILDKEFADLTYDDIKNLDVVKAILSNITEEQVFKHMNDKNNFKKYSGITEALSEDLVKHGPKVKIEFEEFIKQKKYKNQTELCEIHKKSAEYVTLLNIMKDQAKNIDTKKSDVKTELRQNFSLLEKCMSSDGTLEKLNQVYNFFDSYSMKSDVSKDSLITDSGVKKAQTILAILKEGTYMIQNQEVSEEDIAKDKSVEDKGTKEKYPKYTTERMLMSYFIEQFNNSEDVNKFYDEIDRLIKPDKKFADTTLKDKLSIMSKVIEEMPINENVPLAYAGANLIINSATKTITVPETNARTQKKEVSFSETFPDCADTAVRHFLNLLFYCKGENWVPEVVNNELESAKEAVVAAIKSKDDEHKKVEFKSLKERAQMFYLHQTPSRVNDGSEEMRTLWNYVVSNMGKEEVENMGLYKIRYVNDKNYEIDVGYINMLKLIYNIEKALFEGSEERGTALGEAKTRIDSLVTAKPEDYVASLQEAIKFVINVVKLLPSDKVNDQIIVNVSGELTKDISRDDFIGKVGIILKTSGDAKDDISFVIEQNTMHANVELDKSEQKYLDFDLGDFKEDPIIKFFVKRIFANEDVSESADDFYYMLNLSSGSQDSQYLANSRMLRLIKEASGENESNYERLHDLCKKYFSARANLSMNKINLFERLQSIYKNSTFKYFGLSADDFGSAELSEDGNYKFIKREDGVVELCPTTQLKDAESIIIPANIGGFNKYIISKGAFIGFTNLREVTFADGVKIVEIGDFAFRHGRVKKVNVPGSVQTLKVREKAFYETNDFIKFNISAGVKEIEISKVKFADNNLNRIVMIEGEKECSIPNGVFEGILLPETVTISGPKVESLSIGKQAFKRSSIKNLNIENITNKVILQSAAFTESEVTALKMSEGLKSLIVKDEAFQNSNIAEVVIPSSVEELRLSDYSKFKASKSGKLELGPNVKKLVIGCDVLNCIIGEDGVAIIDGLDELGLESFGNFTAKKLTIQDIKKLRLGVGCFNASKLETLDLQSVDVLTLDKLVFYCGGVNNLNLGKSLRQVNLASDAFSGSNGLRVVCDHDIESLKLLDGDENMWLDGRTFEGLKSVGIKEGELKIPDSVKTLTINGCTFIEMKLQKLDLNRVENLTLNDNAFNGFKGKVLTIPTGVKKLTLSGNVFAESDIETVSLEGVEELTVDGSIAFGGKFPNFNIESKLKSINGSVDAFYDKIIVHDEDSRELLEEARSQQVMFMGEDTLEEGEITEMTIGDVIGDGEDIELDLGKSEQLTLNSDVLSKVQEDTLKIPETVKELEIVGYSFSGSEISNLDLGAVEHLTLNGEGFSGFKGTSLKIPTTVKELKIVGYSFSGSEISNLDLGAVEHLMLNEWGLSGFKGTSLKIPTTVKELKIVGYSFSGSEISNLDLGAVEHLMLNEWGLSGFKGTSLKIPTTVKELKIVGYSFSGSEISDLDLGVVKHLMLNGYGFSDFKGNALIIPESVMDLHVCDYAFSSSSIQTLDIEPKLEADKIADSAFDSDALQKIIVHDEESRKLLGDNRSKYGIADTVTIELATDAKI